MALSRSKLLSATFLGLGLASAASAQVLDGRVTDQTGAAPLEGARVVIEELNRTTTTDRFGKYRFGGVPEGTYNLTVSYIGAPNASMPVVIDTDRATLDVKLGDDVRYMENTIIVGSAAAQAGALNQQRAADSILSVIDSDGLGTFPDTTVADSLARVPGLSIENDQGEGRYVSIRGINTDLISASINGVRTPSPEDRRGVLLDGVPSDLLSGITVQKSLTPDVDADSLGGVIDLKTVSAFDREGQYIRAKVEGQYNEITEEFSPKATLSYSNTFGDKLGVALSLNYQKLAIQAHNNEVGEWGEEDDVIVLNDDFEQRFYDLTRERFGFVANFDYRATENTNLYLRTLLNEYVDDEVRNKFEIRGLDEEIVSVTDTMTSYIIDEVDAEVRKREEKRSIQTVSVGGDTQLDALKFDYEVSYAYAEEDDSNNHDVTFRAKDLKDEAGAGVLNFDFSNPQTPVYTGAALADIINPANYEMDAFEQEFSSNEDTEIAAKFNVEYDSFIGSTPVKWKAGLKYRDRDKVRDNNLKYYERDDVLLTDYIVGTGEVSGWELPNAMFNWPDAGLTTGLRGTFTDDEFVDDDSFFDSNIEDYDIQEKILAGYGMGTFNIGDLTLVAGVRVEQTDVDLEGNIVTEGEEDFTKRSLSKDYTNVLPSLNIRYDISDKLIARAAYYAAVVRPGFGDMAPAVVFNDDRDEVELGNPDLDALEADNFDLTLEFYPTELSVLSGGVFYKDIQNAIFPATFDIEDLPDSVDLSFLDAGTLAGVEEVSTYINVGSSSVQGVEFNYVQQLDFLGGLAEGFLVSGNVTMTESESTLPDGRDVPFLKQSDTIWNVAFGYDKGPLDLRISANYRSDYLDDLIDEDVDRYTDDRMLVEASAKYKINDMLQIYLEGKNLTDAEEYYYHGNESRLSQYDEFGRTFIVGARFTY